MEASVTRVLTRLARWIDTANEWTGRGVSILLMAMVVIVAVEVIRRAFRVPSLWEWDVLLYAFAFIVGAGAGYCLLHRGHVIVDVISGRFSPRNKALIDMITSGFFFLGIGVFLWVAIGEAAYSIAVKERYFTILNPPVYPLRVVWVVGIILFMLQGVSKFINDLHIFRTGREISAITVETEDLR